MSKAKPRKPIPGVKAGAASQNGGQKIQQKTTQKSQKWLTPDMPEIRDGQEQRVGPAILAAKSATSGSSWHTIHGWTARHLLDYNTKKNARHCRYCRKRAQFMVDVYNMVTSHAALVCPFCCVKEFSPSSALLLDCLDYLSSVGLEGFLFSKVEPEAAFSEEYEYVFSLKPTARLLRMVDVFRWYFTLSPFQPEGEVVLVTVVPLRPPSFPLRLQTTLYSMQLVAGSWAPRFHSGVTLFAKTFVWKPVISKSKK